MILQRVEQQGIEKGIEKGKIQEVKNLISKLRLSDEQAAEIAEVDMAFVVRVREEMGL